MRISSRSADATFTARAGTLFAATKIVLLSGASDKRPAYQQMLADAEAGQFDVVVSEALDRLGRRLSDVARLYDHLEFRGITCMP